MDNGALTQQRSYDAANQVVGLSYDAAGNLVNDGTTASTYDSLGRMTVRGATSYAYNGDGTLVSRIAGGVTTRYTQDLATPLAQILAEGTNQYVYGAERLFSEASGTRTWYAIDALGSVRQTLSNTGVALTSTTFDPWGVAESGTSAPFGFTGELTDGGMVYLRSRWYEPGAGTFTAKDPFSGRLDIP